MSNPQPTDSTTFFLNGIETKCLGQTSIADLLQQKDALGPGVAVERNKSVVPRSEHKHTMVEAGDKIEIVRLVGGG
ncbi:MAG: sulfur carrier protein ThiS [Planctomycetota bacterium]|nr:sulfur carrier protein ThiS [Planctomycetota bacterium]